MSSPQEQFAELTRRTQENFKTMWQQWSERSTELLKGVRGRSEPTSGAAGNPEAVLDAVFDFAEHMIEQQRAFAKQMLKAASKGQEMATTAGGDHRAHPCPRYPAARACHRRHRPTPRRPSPTPRRDADSRRRRPGRGPVSQARPGDDGVIVAISLPVQRPPPVLAATATEGPGPARPTNQD